MKIALVHDFLREYGGAERVLEAIPRHNASLLARASTSPRKSACSGLRLLCIAI